MFELASPENKLEAVPFELTCLLTAIMTTKPSAAAAIPAAIRYRCRRRHQHRLHGHLRRRGHHNHYHHYHYHYHQQQGLSLFVACSIFSVVCLSIFSVVDLRFSYRSECIHSLIWD
jgi:hypothetical protein